MAKAKKDKGTEEAEGAKEGRSRKSKTDLSSEAGCLILRDLINIKEKAHFNPSFPETYEATDFGNLARNSKKLLLGHFWIMFVNWPKSPSLKCLLMTGKQNKNGEWN